MGTAPRAAQQPRVRNCEHLESVQELPNAPGPHTAADEEGAADDTRLAPPPVELPHDPPTGEFALPAEPAPESRPPDEPPPWQGQLVYVPFSVGDPGRAAAVPAQADPSVWDRRDTVLDGFVLPGSDGGPAVEVRAASTRGRAHRAAGTVRQDAYGYRCTSDGRYLIAAVADGVSAGQLSHFAAEVVARAGSHAVTTRLADRGPDDLDWAAILQELVVDVVNVGRRQLRGTVPGVEGLSIGEIARHLAATALFAVVDLVRQDGGHAVHTFSVGDSAAWVLRSGRTWEPQQPVKNEGAEIASSRTLAIPIVPSEVGPAVRTVLGAGDALVLITDGIGDPLGDGRGPVGAFLAEKWAFPPAALEFAAQVDFARRSHDDDRTAVAVWAAPSP